MNKKAKLHPNQCNIENLKNFQIIKQEDFQKDTSFYSNQQDISRKSSMEEQVNFEFNQWKAENEETQPFHSNTNIF